MKLMSDQDPREPSPRASKELDTRQGESLSVSKPTKYNETIESLNIGISHLAARISELESENKRLTGFVSESVLPMAFDDGTRIFASAISGGADYVDGMPRQVRLVLRDAEGNEIERRYLQTDERHRG